MKKELIKRIEALPAKDGKGRPYVDKKMVIGLIQTMDEPKQAKLTDIIDRIQGMEENLKALWLHKILKELGSDFEQKKFQEGFKLGSWIGRQLINADKIRQELNKPVIPQSVAEYIEQKKNEDYHLLGAMTEIRSHTDDNIELFARAWLDGYEVEKEKRYFVKIRATKHCFTKDGNGRIFFSLAYKSCFTQTELEKAGFGWVFDCEGIEIEEVTE